MTLHVTREALNERGLCLALLLCVLIGGPPRAAAQEPLAPPAPSHPEPTPPLTSAAVEEQPLTLADCFKLALTRSETIAIQQELITETEGRFIQALSGVLPRASFEASEKRQDGSGSSAFTLRKIPERKFVFSQPLFSGFKEFAAMAAVRAERTQRRDEKARAEHMLFVDVSDAFYLLREQREDLGALETTRAALMDRLEELRARERLGRSRPSEAVSAEARLRRVEAEMELVRSRETTARQLLEFLTGLPHMNALSSDDTTLPPLTTENDYIGKVALRPDVLAEAEALRAADKAVSVARADFWPDVDVEGNYYTTRAGVAADVKWDVLLKVNVPLFQGGETVGAVKEASSRARREKLKFEQIQRKAVLEIREVFATLQAAMTRKAALDLALQAAEENYRLQVEDYRKSLVNNLDVLQALEDLQDARRDVIHETYEAQRLYRRLQVATGETP